MQYYVNEKHREVRAPMTVESEAAELREKLEQGTASGEDLARLYFAR